MRTPLLAPRLLRALHAVIAAYAVGGACAQVPQDLPGTWCNPRKAPHVLVVMDSTWTMPGTAMPPYTYHVVKRASSHPDVLPADVARLVHGTDTVEVGIDAVFNDTLLLGGPAITGMYVRCQRTLHGRMLQALLHEAPGGSFARAVTDTAGSAAFLAGRGSYRLPLPNLIVDSVQALPYDPLALVFEAGSKARARTIAAGRVVNIVKMPGAEHMVVLQHGRYRTTIDGLRTVKVRTGDVLRRGDVLGIPAGTAFHLPHFSIWEIDPTGHITQLDPARWFAPW